jgi:hypothetical protein
VGKRSCRQEYQRDIYNTLQYKLLCFLNLKHVTGSLFKSTFKNNSFFFAGGQVLGFELSASSLLGQCSTPWPIVPAPHHYFSPSGNFKQGLTFCPGQTGLQSFYFTFLTITMKIGMYPMPSFFLLRWNLMKFLAPAGLELWYCQSQSLK